MQKRHTLLPRLVLVAAIATLGASAAQAASYYAVLPMAGVDATQSSRPVQIALAGTTPPPAYVGVPYSFNLGALVSLDGPEGTDGSKVAWSIFSGELPAGLALVGSTISGTPTAVSAPASLKIRAEYAHGFQSVGAMQGYAFEVYPTGIMDFGVYRAWGDGTFAQSCEGYMHSGSQVHPYAGATGDGVYRLQLEGLAPFDARCDMTTDGGGWTVFQRRVDGSVDFYLGIADYIAGFGNTAGEYWLGLERVRVMTAGGRELRVDLGRFNGQRAYAKYSSFSLGAAPSYALELSAYEAGTAGDGFRWPSGHSSVGRGFSTKDRDLDTSPNSCSILYRNAGWFERCFAAGLNGTWFPQASVPYGQGIQWIVWVGDYESLNFSEMKFR